MKSLKIGSFAGHLRPQKTALTSSTICPQRYGRAHALANMLGVVGSEEARLNIVETQISNSVVKGKAESKALPKLLLGRKAPSQIGLNMVSI